MDKGCHLPSSWLKPNQGRSGVGDYAIRDWVGDRSSVSLSKDLRGSLHSMRRPTSQDVMYVQCLTRGTIHSRLCKDVQRSNKERTAEPIDLTQHTTLPPSFADASHPDRAKIRINDTHAARASNRKQIPRTAKCTVHAAAVNKPDLPATCAQTEKHSRDT